MRTSKDDSVAAFCLLEHFAFGIFTFFGLHWIAFGFIFFAFYYDIIYNIKI